MPENTRAQENSPIEDAIAAWRRSLKDLADAQKDELEDHLRSELAKLDGQPLSPRERVLVAADRLGDPAAISKQVARESALVLTIPAWLMVGGILAAATLGSLTAVGIIDESYKEIDDTVNAALGRGAAAWLVYATQALCVAVNLAVGLLLIRRVIRRYATGYTWAPIRTRWPVVAALFALVLLGVVSTPHIVRETFNEIDEPIEAVLGRGFTMWAEIGAHVLLAGAIVAAGFWLLHREQSQPRSWPGIN